MKILDPIINVSKVDEVRETLSEIAVKDLSIMKFSALVDRKDELSFIKTPSM